jgi:hypothetical protein
MSAGDPINCPPNRDRSKFLEVSPYASDGGQLIGRHPRTVPVADLRALDNPASVIKAVRAKCIDCCCGQESEVRKCTAVFCALWPFRMGHNPFHAKAASDAGDGGGEILEGA